MLRTTRRCRFAVLVFFLMFFVLFDVVCSRRSVLFCVLVIFPAANKGSSLARPSNPLHGYLPHTEYPLVYPGPTGCKFNVAKTPFSRIITAVDVMFSFLPLCYSVAFNTREKLDSSCDLVILFCINVDLGNI